MNCWDKNGITVLYVHCIPGGQTSKECLKYFDLDKFYVILFDQRGCGKSYTRFCIANNDTKNFVSNIEKIIIHLNIDRWILFGGCWGSTLSLVYLIYHSERVNGLILRDIFLGQKKIGLAIK